MFLPQSDAVEIWTASRIDKPLTKKITNIRGYNRCWKCFPSLPTHSQAPLHNIYIHILIFLKNWVNLKLKTKVSCSRHLTDFQEECSSLEQVSFNTLLHHFAFLFSFIQYHIKNDSISSDEIRKDVGLLWYAILASDKTSVWSLCI